MEPLSNVKHCEKHGDSELQDTVSAFQQSSWSSNSRRNGFWPPWTPCSLWMLAPEKESPAFPMEHDPSPLNLFALERRQLIFLSGIDKGFCCPRVKGLGCLDYQTAWPALIFRWKPSDVICCLIRLTLFLPPLVIMSLEHLIILGKCCMHALQR